MKFICLGFIDPATFASASEAEANAMIDSCCAYDDQLRAHGHFKGGEGLQPPNTAKTLRYAKGRLLVTDGPFAETKEQLGGIMILEARDLDHAVELISKHPGAKFGPWEIRPAADLTEMVRQSEARRRQAGTTFSTSREIPAPVDHVFAAIRDPERLARWWGPAGFTNTFHVCEFKNGGRWSFTMHGPNGSNHPNENRFVEIEPLKQVVVEHVAEPRYRLTLSLAPSDRGTIVHWSQLFENRDVAQQLEHIVVPANDQNLERLSVEVVGRQNSH
jgi:uncharacterized protein YndB with AHSA1/START domain